MANIRNSSFLVVRRFFSNQTSHDVGVLGLPMWHGQKKSGTELAPAELRKSGILKAMRSSESVSSIQDFGDVDFQTCGEYDGVRYMSKASMLIRQSVSACLEKCSLLVNLGGDHSVGMGTVSGHSDYARAHGKEIAVLWVDAHADINTPMTSYSGSWHGMPVSFLIHQMAKFLPRMQPFNGWKSSIDAGSIAFIGLRDVDPLEKFFLDRLQISHYSMREIDAMGMSTVINRALESIDPAGTKSLHVSFDIDVIDPLQAKSTGTPVPGGITLREAAVLAEAVVSTRRLRTLDIVEVNPLIGNQDDVASTFDSAHKTVRWMLGEQRQGRQPLVLDKQKFPTDSLP